MTTRTTHYTEPEFFCCMKCGNSPLSFDRRMFGYCHACVPDLHMMVILWLNDGITQKQAAFRLGIRPETVCRIAARYAA